MGQSRMENPETQRYLTSLTIVTNSVIVMNEERTGKCLRQLEDIHGHLWHRYSVKVYQVMVATVNLSKWWAQLNQ
jgi:hypothetical protein